MIKINLFSSPPKTKQFSLLLCPCVSKGLSLGRVLATVPGWPTHILPHAIKIPLKITISMQQSRNRIKQESKISITMIIFGVENYKVKFLVAGLGDYFYSAV